MDSACLTVFSCTSTSELVISSLNVSVFYMRLYFRSQSCFSGVLGYPRRTVVEELRSDGAEVYCLILLILLSLLFAICSSLILSGLGFSIWNLPTVSLIAANPLRDLCSWLQEISWEICRIWTVERGRYADQPLKRSRPEGRLNSHRQEWSSIFWAPWRSQVLWLFRVFSYLLPWLQQIPRSLVNCGVLRGADLPICHGTDAFQKDLCFFFWEAFTKVYTYIFTSGNVFLIFSVTYFIYRLSDA